MLDAELIDMMRAWLVPFELDDDSLAFEALVDAMAANPILIERPIVVLGEKACLGRPPENVAAFLEDAGLSRGQA